jgi:hypothetical protein
MILGRIIVKRAIMLITMISLCSIVTLTTSAQRRSSRRASSNVSTNQDEGQREAGRFWRNYIASCGGSNYARKAPGIFVELRGFNIRMDYEPITEADKLNGVQAKGYSRFGASAYRIYSNSAWHTWGNGIPEDMNLTNSVRFQKAGGRWSFRGVGYFNDYARTVSCSDVPGMGGSTRNEVPTNSIQIDDYHNFPIEQFAIWDSNTNESGNRFAQSTTTFINWKIIYTETAFSYRPPQVESYWYKDGEKWSYADSANFSNSGKGQLWTGKGWEEPGHWEVGKYRIKIYVGKKLVTVGAFEIAPDNEFPQDLRFDGLYKTASSNKSDNKSNWLRFYEDGTVLLAIGVPNDIEPYRLGICVSLEREKYAEGCDRFEYRVNRYNLSGNKISFSWPAGSNSVQVDVNGTIGHNILNLNYDLPTAHFTHPNIISTFVSVGRLY